MAPPPKKKRNLHNNIFTLRDIGQRDETTTPEQFSSYPTDSIATPSSSSSSLSSSNCSLLQHTHHIPNLPQAEEYAKGLLQRVVLEFEPIVKQRGYNVRSVSEFCCCNDGLDFIVNNNKNNNGKKLPRKRRKQSNNVLGYNQTTTFGGGSRRKSHTIHLRLRHASNHNRFFLYEDVAGTMAHELAHCVHGPHNKAFYQLMDEILDQHAVLVLSGMTTMTSSSATLQPPLSVFTGTGHKLGGERKEQQKQQNGYKLGGDNLFSQWMTPAEAAVAAAEARRRKEKLRLRGDRCCRPCTIDLVDDDDDDDNNEQDENIVEDNVVETLHDNKKEELNIEKYIPPDRKRAPQPKPITIDISAEKENKALSKTIQKASAAVTTPAAWIDLTYTEEPTDQWPCRLCTFLNRPVALACEVCRAERKLY